MSALFPDVPFTAGVPPVLRNATNMIDAAQTLLLADNYASAGADEWGVFDQSGNRIVFADSVVSVEYGGEYQISDYPTEAGGFQSYNKVARPFEIRTTMTKGGSVADRQAFMTAFDIMRTSLSLVDISTPERVYTGVNLTRIAQARTAQSGAGLAVIEAIFQEVRETVKTTYAKVDPVVPPIPPQSAAASASPTAPKSTPSFSFKSVTNPWTSKPVSQGAVQPKSVVNGAQLVTTGSGRKLYVYNKPIGL